jgi:beta-aspartyl-dipeptidase (metallo-type)
VGSTAVGAGALRALLARGQPLERMLPAFTANPARVLRLGRKGHLAPGADADLVVLDGTGGVSDVMARGRWHVRDGRAVVRGVFEADGALGIVRGM